MVQVEPSVHVRRSFETAKTRCNDALAAVGDTWTAGVALYDPGVGCSR
jgi:hypothetical protein